MTHNLSIGGRDIGCDAPVFIIAEAGVNHNGDLELAKELIRQAKRCGADSVKFQTFKAEALVLKEAPKATYQLKTTDPTETQLAMLQALELKSGDYAELIQLCKKEDIIFLSTPYSTDDADYLESLGVGAFKIASAQIVEPVFLQHIAKKMKPIILSTGMATLAEVDEAVRVIRETGNDEIVVLQCTTNYPSFPEDANLRAMKSMEMALGVLVGYSDHTQTDTACVVATALGARLIEKHFTLDNSLDGPDHSSSANPTDFALLVKRIREAEQVLGAPLKKPTNIEMKNAQGMRRSVVTGECIPKGTVIQESMLVYKRPGTGYAPARIHEIIGRTAKVDISKDSFISFELLQ